jgi:hypothetical protein
MKFLLPVGQTAFLFITFLIFGVLLVRRRRFHRIFILLSSELSCQLLLILLKVPYRHLKTLALGLGVLLIRGCLLKLFGELLDLCFVSFLGLFKPCNFAVRLLQIAKDESFFVSEVVKFLEHDGSFLFVVFYALLKLVDS